MVAGDRTCAGEVLLSVFDSLLSHWRVSVTLSCSSEQTSRIAARDVSGGLAGTHVRDRSMTHNPHELPSFCCAV